jgi:hypothetical protein
MYCGGLRRRYRLLSRATAESRPASPQRPPARRSGRPSIASSISRSWPHTALDSPAYESPNAVDGALFNRTESKVAGRTVPTPGPISFLLTCIACGELLSICASSNNSLHRTRRVDESAESYHLTSSTRLFLLRPSSESLAATGEYQPAPNESSRLAITENLDVNSCTTLAARRRLRSRL